MLKELVEQMQQSLNQMGSEVGAFSEKHMKRKLMERYGGNVIFAQSGSLPTIVTLKSSCSNILQEYFKNQRENDNPEDKKAKIIKAAAKLLKADIGDVTCSREEYPCSENIASKERNLEYLPPSLQVFLSTLLKKNAKKAKIAAIGQAIMQCTRPKTLLAPLQIGLGVQMHHLFGSRFLIDALHRLGFSCSYDEVLRFKDNAAMVGSTGMQEPVVGSFVQFIADNADHNAAPLSMEWESWLGFPPLSRLTGRCQGTVSARKIFKLQRKMSIKPWTQEKKQPPLLYGKHGTTPIHTSWLACDLLWKISWPLRQDRPSWSGWMQGVAKGSHPGKSSFQFLPMIDLDPSNMTCVNSTLHFICDQAAVHEQHPIVTVVESDHDR
jgi:hypothetical protein